TRAAWRRRGAAAVEQQGGLRGRGGLRDRRSCEGCARDRRDGARGRVHAVQRPLRPRLPVQDAAVDARQGLRRGGALRPRARDQDRGARRRSGLKNRPQLPDGSCVNGLAHAAAPPIAGPALDNKRVAAALIDLVVLVGLGFLLGTLSGSFTTAARVVTVAWV